MSLAAALKIPERRATQAPSLIPFLTNAPALVVDGRHFFPLTLSERGCVLPAAPSLSGRFRVALQIGPRWATVLWHNDSYTGIGFEPALTAVELVMLLQPDFNKPTAASRSNR